MNQNRGKLQRIRSAGSIVTSIAVILFIGGCAHSGPPGPQPVPQPATLSPTSTAVSSCGQGYEPVSFVNTVTGKPVGELTVCASESQPDTLITNTSDSTVWYVAEPAGFSYWSFGEDVADPSVNATDLLFRTVMRTLGGGAPTIEPGTTVKLSVVPGAIQLKQDPGEQAVWQEASLLVESAVDKSKEELTSILEDNSNSTGAAMIACMSAGYTLGESLTSQNESADEIQSMLTGIFDNSQECGSKIDEAQQTLRSEGKTPELTLGKVDDETHIDHEWEDSGRAVDEAVTIGRDLLKLHE
jgi:hypothetical protein